MSGPPPYAADVRSRGWRFELDLEQVQQSDTWALAPADIRPWLLMLWTTAWQQQPCGSMPAEDALIAARLGMPAKLLAKHRSILLRGWTQHDDGRLYHATITHRVLAMLEVKNVERQRKADYRARMDAERRARPSVDVPRDRDGTDEGQAGDSGGSDATGTGTGTGTSIKNKEKTIPRPPRANAPAPARDGPASASPLDGFAPTLAGQVGMAMRQAGVDMLTVNLADPRLAELLAQGASVDEFEGLAAEAVRKGIDKPWPWMLTVLPARRKQAKGIVLPQQGKHTGFATKDYTAGIQADGTIT